MSEPTQPSQNQGFRVHTAAEWLVRLSEEEVAEETVARWIEWCDADDQNLRAFEEMESLWRAAALHPPGERELARLFQSDDLGESFGLAGRRRRLQGVGRRWMAVATSVGAIGALALVLASHFNWLPADNRGVRHAEAIDLVSTPLAMNQEAVLPDGSRVDLGARSALDVEFTGTQRRLELRNGQAFFRVKHDTLHPFVVEAGRVRVTAVGTAFDVRKTATQVAITVQEGTVEVMNEAGTGAAPVRATAGYQLVIDRSTGTTRRSIVDPEMATAWRSGRLEFAGDPLEVVIASVNRYSARPVVIEDPVLGKLSFTGTVFVDAIDASLDAMQQVFPLRVERSAHEILLVGRDK